MKIHFIGHSAFYLETTKIRALIDPFITNNPSTKEKIENYNSITHIFVTHGHSDHLGDTIELAKANNALVITNHEIAHYLSKFQIRVHAMHIGGRKKFEFGTVKMTPALHGSSIQVEETIIEAGNPCGFVIESDGKKLYHAGDTGLTMDMKLLEIENIDLALIPIGGNFTMDIDDALKSIEFIQPKAVIPMHYNTFEVISASPQDFKNKAKETEVIILNPGDEYII